ncbi:hypothetical protein [Candidatus Uabimicrobium sp. HlEnr_7]|uniref:hypothetical protein n=1 Tax=Candidatus Uabimicrobium helgolandensis TaxID=3095367 RepID=UPI003555F65E
MKKFIFVLGFTCILNFAYCDKPFSVSKEYDYLEKDYRFLNNIAVEGDWNLLEKHIKEMNYIKRIEKLVNTKFSLDFDRQGKKKKQLQKWFDELKIWLVYIYECGRGRRDPSISEILSDASRKISEVEELYYKGKEIHSEHLLIRVLEITNNVTPGLNKHIDSSKKKQVQPLLKRYIYFSKLARTELEIIDKIKRIKIDGTIYFSNPQEKWRSVAFIEKQIWRVNDRLKNGFVVKEIRYGEVLFEYKKRRFVLRKE